MKKLLWLLLILPALACNGTFMDPIANLSAGVSTETAIAAPTPPAASIAAAGTASPNTCIVIADALHLRDAPNIDGLVIAWLSKADQLTILPDPPAGDWRKVMTADNITGWINSIYCKR